MLANKGLDWDSLSYTNVPRERERYKCHVILVVTGASWLGGRSKICISVAFPWKKAASYAQHHDQPGPTIEVQVPNTKWGLFDHVFLQRRACKISAAEKPCKFIAFRVCGSTSGRGYFCKRMDKKTGVTWVRFPFFPVENGKLLTFLRRDVLDLRVVSVLPFSLFCLHLRSP